MIETSADFRLAVQLCQLVVETAVDPNQGAPAVGKVLAQLREVLEGAPQINPPPRPE